MRTARRSGSSRVTTTSTSGSSTSRRSELPASTTMRPRFTAAVRVFGARVADAIESTRLEMRSVMIVAASALYLGACRYDVNTARFSVMWSVDGPACMAEPLPWVEVQTKAKGPMVDSDDEYVDWFPCQDAITGAPQGVTAPIPLGSYSISARLYDAFDGPSLLGQTTGDQPGELALQDEVVFPPM